MSGGGIARWLASTSNRVFIVFPIAIGAIEAAWAHGLPRVSAWALPLLAWGYLQYKLAGRYRLREGGGGPGLAVPPQRLVTGGPYAYVRNPMYLGHLIFLAGLAIFLRSWIGAALFAYHVVWFHRRARSDEARLAKLFGDDYSAYVARVKRWLPGLI